MAIGSFGRTRVFEDFLGAPEVTAMTTIAASAGNWGYVCVNEGTMVAVSDEPNGVWTFNTDTADNDNFALFCGPFRAADGGVVMEARLKVAAITTSALFVGFTETLDATTPVMPAEFATATMTYNGTGAIVGLQWDADGTTNDWRAVFGDGGAVKSNADANGTRAYEAAVNDEWDVIKVEVSADAVARVWLNGRVIKEITSAVTTTDLLFPVVMVENRSGASNALEIDYAFADGGRDWSVT
jgi:hypothetical protein